MASHFSENQPVVLFKAEDGTYWWVARYTATNFDVGACLIPVPSHPEIDERLNIIDHVVVKYSKSVSGAANVRTYLSLYPVPGDEGVQQETLWTDADISYLVWKPKMRMFFPASGNIAAIACLGYSSTDDMQCRIVGRATNIRRGEM